MTTRLQPGAEVAGHRIVDVLGVGAMGVVYEAVQRGLGRPIALKVLPARTLSPATRARFEREARLQAMLDHPHVVAVHEAGEAPEGLYIAMRLLRGGTLRDALHDGLDAARALRLLRPVADALDAAHHARMVHRDVKPENILLEDDQAFLADFGLVRALDRASMTGDGGVAGTPDYLAPEQARGERAGPAADVYALAAVLFECLTGTVVFPRATPEAAVLAHATAPPPRPSDVRPGLPRALDDVLAGALAKEPRARPPTAGALVERVAAALGTTLPAAPARARRLATVVRAPSAAPDRLAAVVERHGGAVHRLDDGTAAGVFGLAARHEDDGARAARAALELATADTVVTVDSGPVEVRAGAAGRRRVAGAAVARAVALAATAAPGDVIVGDGAKPLVEAVVGLERAPADGWRVTGLLDAPGPAHDAVAFVDRRRELTTLVAVVQDALELRACRLATVVGAPGIGKSRLVRELAAAVPAGVTVATGRCPGYGDGRTYHPIAELLAQLPERARASAPARRVLAAIGADPDPARREEVFLDVRRTLELAAPVVAVVEDAHWAEPTLLDLLDHLAAFSTGAPVTAVVAGRAELLDAHPDWAAPQPGRTLLPLDPLPDEHAAALARAAADGDLDPGLAARIVDAAGGNPLFLEQLVAVRGESAALPPTLHALLAARVDRLEPGERAALERAAVAGRTFPVALVAALTPPEQRPRLTSHLLGLVRRQLIRPEAPAAPGEDGFAFAHGLIRDAAYDGVAPAHRSALHEGAADWLAARARTTPEQLGHHLEQAARLAQDDRAAALAARAAPHLVDAAHDAHTRGDLPAAAALLQRAVDLTSHDDAARAERLTRLGVVELEQGALAAAEATLGAALEAARRGGDAAAAARAEVELRLVGLHADPDADLEAARAVATAARRVLGAARDDAGCCRAWRLTAWTAWTAGRAGEAERAWERAAACAAAAGDERERREVLGWIASAAAFGPTPVAEGIARCTAIRRQVRGSPVARAVVLRPLALLHAYAGDVPRARRLLREANATLGELGRMHSAISHHEAQVELLAGAPARAQRRLRADLARLEAMGERALAATTAALLAQAALAGGDVATARRLHAAHAAATSAGDHGTVALWAGVGAAVALDEGRLGAAEAAARIAVGLLASTDALTDHGDALMTLAAVLDAAGRQREARRVVRRALRLYDRKGAAVLAARARARLEPATPAS